MATVYFTVTGAAVRYFSVSDHSRPMPTLVELAANALSLATPAAQRHWLDQLRQIEEKELRNVLARVPTMSDPARTFAGIVLGVNRKRVLDVCA